MPDPRTPELGDIVSPAQLCKLIPALTRGKLGWMLFHRETNGLAPHVAKHGNALYIDSAGFRDWLMGRGTCSNFAPVTRKGGQVTPMRAKREERVSP